MVPRYVIESVKSIASAAGLNISRFGVRGSTAHKQLTKLLSTMVILGLVLGFAGPARANPSSPSALPAARNSLLSWANSQSRNAQRQLAQWIDNLEKATIQQPNRSRTTRDVST
jgi:hypothetical protein